MSLSILGLSRKIQRTGADPHRLGCLRFVIGSGSNLKASAQVLAFSHHVLCGNGGLCHGLQRRRWKALLSAKANEKSALRGFGDKVVELSNFSTSAVYLCRAFLRDVQLMPVYDITPLFGAGLILLFYLNMIAAGDHGMPWPPWPSRSCLRPCRELDLIRSSL